MKYFTASTFYSFYRHRHGGTRSYSWVKQTLQARAPLPGIMIRQDGSTYEWVAARGGTWWIQVASAPSLVR